MTNNNSQVGSANLATLLTNMNAQGGFPITVLADQQGFPIAYAATDDQDPDSQAAVVALIQQTVTQASSQLGLADTDEISLFDTSGRRLVCRSFKINDDDLILAVLVPDKKQSYRRLTNTVINRMRKQWEL